MDAAYVAERILTMEELKTYVERHWPEPDVADLTPGKAPGKTANGKPHPRRPRPWKSVTSSHAGWRVSIGGRRPGRSFRRVFARLGHIGRLAGTGAERSRFPRAGARPPCGPQPRFSAPTVWSWSAPRWSPTGPIHEGQYDYGITASERTNSLTLPPTRDELARYEAAGVEPEARFHYRDLAADLAWEAAELMPDNTDETANVLNTAGRWPNDVKVADRFYKALVNRCRKTTLGQAADNKRWFPRRDEHQQAPE